ncbi:MFS transporter [Candidimonas humi]|uniref:MFS transporter n=1 Tax=Candidimonas humi TaxID=683355 RepID=A0ABV8NWU5_9BURK|nr:MFS transporter [Candidimonas humi]MBV6305140.1 MFS transporter [Candidimonas humi]
MLKPAQSSLPAPFRYLAWSNLAAQCAEQIGLAASPIFAVLALGAGAGETGILQMAQTLPFLLFAIPIGLLADRVHRSRLMAATEALRTASLLCIVLLAATGLITLPLLALLGFVGACGTVAYSVTAPATVPGLVNGSDLPRANARIELARTSAYAAGPALGGLLVGHLGAVQAFSWAAALSLAAVLLLSRVGEPARSTAPRRRAWLELKEGAAFVLGHPLLLPVFVTQLIFNTAFFMLYSAYVPHAMARLHLSAQGVGETLSAYGAGMIIGALCATRVMRRLNFGTVIATGPVAGLAGGALMALTIWLPYPALAAAAFLLLGAGPILWVISTTTLRQTITPPQLLGRVSAINILAYGARPIGASLGALIGGEWGAQACLLAAVVAFAMQAAVILISPVSRLAERPATVAA